MRFMHILCYIFCWLLQARSMPTKRGKGLTIQAARFNTHEHHEQPKAIGNTEVSYCIIALGCRDAVWRLSCLPRKPGFLSSTQALPTEMKSPAPAKVPYQPWPCLQPKQTYH